jgi:hypothetical protein
MVINIFITYRWGITAIILGQIAAVLVACLLGSYYVWRLIGYSVWQQLRDVFPYFAISTAMYFVVVLISKQIFNSSLTLVVMTFTGIVFYFFVAWLFNLEEIKEMKIIYKKWRTNTISNNS